MSIWQEVKEKVQIEEVISEYVAVKSKGLNFTCVCPFHQEKTPSLIISPDKQIWHCFGCGAGGDVFAFVAMVENISRWEVLTKLAKQAGVTVPKKTYRNNSREENFESEDFISSASEGGEKTEGEKEKGQKLLEFTAEVYHQILLKILENRDHAVTQYCLERGLTLDLIRKFKIGYAPKTSVLIKLAKQHNLDFALLEKIGVLKNVT